MKKIMKHCILPTAKKTCMAVLFGFGICIVAAIAQSEGDEAMPLSRIERETELLRKYDLNRNGKLDPEEVELIARDRLMKWDLNKDGKLDAYELSLMRAASKQMPERAKINRSVNRRNILRQKLASSASDESRRPITHPANNQNSKTRPVTEQTSPWSGSNK